MQEDIKCPQCGGNRFKELGNDKYKCFYCGSTFTHKEAHDEPPAPPVPEPAPAAFNQPYGQPYPQNMPPYAPLHTGGKSKTTALLLCFFLGGFGAHKFYLGQTGWGILYLVFCWTWIPSIIALVEFIILLCTSTEDFNYKYN